RPKIHIEFVWNRAVGIAIVIDSEHQLVPGGNVVGVRRGSDLLHLSADPAARAGRIRKHVEAVDVDVDVKRGDRGVDREVKASEVALRPRMRGERELDGLLPAAQVDRSGAEPVDVSTAGTGILNPDRE